jgi:hypothetical protein
MGQRIFDQFQHLPVELGVRPKHGQLDLFVHLMCQVADQPGQLVPGVPDRLHAGLHDPFLQV